MKGGNMKWNTCSSTKAIILYININTLFATGTIDIKSIRIILKAISKYFPPANNTRRIISCFIPHSILLYEWTMSKPKQDQDATSIYDHMCI